MPRNYTPRVACICDGCGKTIQKIPSKVRPRNFCSYECRHSGTQKTCAYCGSTYVVDPRRVDSSHWCSKRCWGLDKRRPLADRFREKVDMSGGPDACWNWVGASQVQGYGTIHVAEKRDKVRATHVAWFLEYGVWPKKWMLHTCDNPPCCNPRHLFEGDARSNNRDTVSKGRRPMGEAHHGAILSDVDVQQVRERYDSGETVASIARLFPKVSEACIRDIAKGRRRNHVA